MGPARTEKFLTATSIMCAARTAMRGAGAGGVSATPAFTHARQSNRNRDVVFMERRYRARRPQ